jgi:hypothetical protein
MNYQVIALVLWWVGGCLMVGAFVMRTAKRLSVADALAIIGAGWVWPIVFVLYWMLVGADNIEIWRRK